MKKGWETKRLDEVCQFTSGLWNGEKPPFLTVGVIRNTNFTKDGAIDDTNIAFLEVEAKKFEKRRLQFGDIILEKSGGGPKQPVGRVALFLKKDGDFSFSNFTAALRVKDADELHFCYLHKYLYFIYQSGITEAMQSHSTGIRNLDGDAYKAIEIPIPPLPEQRRIVGVLDEAFASLAIAQANAQKNLQNARELFDSYLNEVFTKRGDGWVEKTLGDVSQFKNGLNYSQSSGGQTLPVVGVADFQDNYFVPISQLQSATIDGALADIYAIQPNDILTVRSNGSKKLVGRCMLVGDVDEVVSYSGFIIRIRFDAKSIFPKFLLHFMKCKITRDILTAGGGGANINNINQDKLSALLVPIPPYKTQVKLAVALDELREETQRLARIYEQKQAALAELKKSLLHQAFSGEL